MYPYGAGGAIVYLNELGKSYDPNDSEIQDLNNERHWLRRACTFQETVGPSRFVVAGAVERAVHPLSAQAINPINSYTKTYDQDSVCMSSGHY